MIKDYTIEATYTAEGLPTSESKLSFIESTKEVKIDGINVQVKYPVCGDAVYHDGEKIVFFKGGAQLNHDLLKDKYTKVGEVVGYKGDLVLIVHHANQGTLKWCDCVLWAITNISNTTIKLNMRMVGDWETNKVVEVTLPDTQLNEANAELISDALDAAGWNGNVGYSKHKWWAYYDNNRIIVQNDQSSSYRLSLISILNSGITASLVVYGDMPANDRLFRNNKHDVWYGGLSFSRFKEWYSTNGITPTANVPIKYNDIINLSSFENSQYCELLRETYGTYDEYLKDNMVKFPQKRGNFLLPDGKTLTYKYGDDTFVTKTGEAKIKYPAMHKAKSLSFAGIKGIDLGDWYLPDTYDAMLLMNDDNRDKINATVAKFGSGSSTIINTSTRWFSRRAHSLTTWHFYGNSGNLSNSYVHNSFIVLGVALLNINA